MDYHSPIVWVLAITAALCVGAAKTGFGGLGLVAILFAAEIFPAKESTGVILPLMIFGDIVAVYLYRRHANWQDLLKLLPTTLIGVVCGWWIMPHIPDAQFTLCLGWLILGLMLLTILQRCSPGMMGVVMHHPALGLMAGWVTGLASMMANAAGAITAFYFLARKMDKMTFVGTAAWFFLIVNLSKVPFSIQLGLISRDSLQLDLLLLPAVVVGGIVGKVILHKVSQTTFEWVTIVLAALAAIRLIW